MNFLALRSSGNDPRRNLALEEALLGSTSAPPYVLLLYANDPCVVIGRNQNPWVEAAAGSRLPLFRRVSGGGAVYQDRGNLNWALVVPRSRHDPEAEVGLVAHALEVLGVATRSGKRGGLFIAGGPLDGRKISGTARRLTASRVLHHGTHLVNSDLDRLERSLGGGLAVSTSRALASVRARPANLVELLPDLDLEAAATALIEGLCGSSPAAEVETAILDFVEPETIESISRRLASWEWTYAETPPFSLKIDASCGPLEVEVRGGLVSALEGPGTELLPDTQRRELIGSRFHSHLPERFAPLS
jgi:lipoate-protein ligase A